MSALILSFALVPVMGGVDQSVLDRLDLMAAMNQGDEFRQYVIYVMDHEDVGTHTSEAFNWTMPLSENRTFDVKAALLAMGEKGLVLPINRMMPDQIYERKYREFMAAFEYIHAHFPMVRLRTWLALHPESLRLGSDGFFGMCNLATCLLLMVLCVSMLLYLSLTLGYSRENPDALTKWQRVGVPMVILLYAVIIAASAMWMIGICVLSYATSARIKQSLQFLQFGMYIIVLGGSVSGAFGASASLFMSCQSPPDVDAQT